MISNLADFHFIRPYWFLALLPAALFIMLSVKRKLARGSWSEVCDEALLPFILQDSDNNKKYRWSLITMSLASLLAIIALAGPTWEQLPTPAFRNDAALVIALDLSLSMNVNDIKPSRLIRARYKIADILQQRKDGLTALIAYAGDAFTVTPLTSDNATISNQLNALSTDIMPIQGSNTLAALNQAVTLLKQAGQQQGSILLIADEVDIDSITQAQTILGNYSLSILGIGTTEGSPIKQADGGFLKDPQGNIVIPKLNASQLAALASSGGGIYKTISSDDSDIKALIASSDVAVRQETAKDSEHLVKQWLEQGPWLLLILLPLMALFFRKGLLIIPLILVMNYPQESYAFEWQGLWKTPDQQAQQAFNQQQYEQAAAQFKSPEWQAAAEYKAEKYEQAADILQPLEQHTADSYYNQATAFAKAGQLKPALDIYEKALKLNPEHEDALYNKKLVEEALDKQKQEQNKEQDNQQSDPNSSEKNKNDSQDGKPSDQADDQQSQQEKQDKQPEDSSNEQQNEDQNSQNPQENNNVADTPDQPTEEEQNKDTQQQPTQDADDEQHKDAQQQSAQDADDSEKKQAQEQWLNRIPDDPAGLLKRKFKYQYGQRNQSNKSSQQDKTW